MTDAASPPDPAIGTIVAGRYRIEAWLGEGTLGIIYRAREVVLDRPVAVTRVRPELAADRAWVQRLLVAGRALSRVRDPGLVPIVELDGAGAFLVMELAVGPSLHARLAGEPPLAGDAALRILEVSCAAVASLHDAGLFHGRLTLEKVILGDRGARLLPSLAALISPVAAVAILIERDLDALVDLAYAMKTPVPSVVDAFIQLVAKARSAREMLEACRSLLGPTARGGLDDLDDLGDLFGRPSPFGGRNESTPVTFPTPQTTQTTTVTHAEPPPPPPPPTGLVHWNSRFVDDPAVNATSALAVGRIYALETALETAADERAAATAALPAAMLAAAAVVRFEARARGAAVRVAGARDFGEVAASGDLPYTRGGTAPFRVEVCADAPGPVRLTLSLYTGATLLMRTTLALTANAVASPAAGPPQPLVALRPAVAAQLTTARPARVRLEITDDGALQLEIDPARERPRQPYQSLDQLADIAIRLRGRLVALSEAYRPDPAHPPFGIQDAGAVLLEFARIGAEMHEAFFGLADDVGVDADLKRLAEALVAQGEAGEPRPRLQIVAEHLPFPWAVMYDGAYAGRRLDGPGDVDLRSFWGARFLIDRAVSANLDGEASAVLPAPIDIRLCLNTLLDAEQRLDVVRAQRDQFAGLPGTVSIAPIESRDQFERYLRDDRADCDLLYFFCHARAAETVNAMFFRPAEPPKVQASIQLDASGEIDVKTMRQLRLRPLRGRPLVFMNACSSAAGDQAFQSVFLSHFVNTWRARGFVGTDWKVPTVFADAFARRMLHGFLGEGLAIGDAFARTADEAFAQGNPFPLIYALYVRPDLTVGQGA